LGMALGSLGSQTNDVDLLQQALTAFRNEQEVFTREDNAEGWASTQSFVALTTMHIGTMQKAPGLLEEAISAIKDCLEIDPDNEDYKDTLQQIEAAIEEVKGGKV
jgi:tetratricopeptide (TPR) repeat protein